MDFEHAQANYAADRHLSRQKAPEDAPAVQQARKQKPRRTKVQLDGDLSRLERALHVHVKQTRPGHYMAGELADEIYFIDLTDAQKPTCNCPDFKYRGKWCKHILACKLSVLDRSLIDGLCDLISALRHALQEPTL